MAKRALITGVTGQDGAYLCKLLAEKGYEVFGAYRRSSDLSDWRLRTLGVASEVQFVSLELLELSNVVKVLEKTRPDEIYNLGAQSFVAASFEQPIYTADVNAIGVLRLLEAIRIVDPAIRFYQASTSEMFGKVTETPQSESTPFHPRSPYAVSKVFAHWATVNYREAYGLSCSSGILFNHESKLRGREFVTRKISRGLARVSLGQQDVLELGNLDAKRDWGHAFDYVRGMWLMLQQERSSDYVLGTGKTRSVREFAELAAQFSGIQLEWSGEGTDEVGVNAESGKTIIRINPEFYRPAEVDVLLADASKAERELGWVPQTSFSDIVKEMVEADLAAAAG